MRFLYKLFNKNDASSFYTATKRAQKFNNRDHYQTLSKQMILKILGFLIFFFFFIRLVITLHSIFILNSFLDIFILLLPVSRLKFTSLNIAFNVKCLH